MSARIRLHCLSSSSKYLGPAEWVKATVALAAIAIMCFSYSAATAAARPAKVTLNISEGTNFSASVSPDKRNVVLDLQSNLWILPLSGGAAKQITDWKLEALLPTWSPKGDLIAFEAFAGGGYHIWTIRPDGSGLTQHTFGPHDDREPSWSPDGNQLVFASDRGGDGSFDIWSINLTDGVLVRRTSAPSEEYEPAWSPDGKSIAFVEDGHRIVAIDLMGQRRTLVEKKETIHSPAWWPDSSDIVYEANGELPDGTLYSHLVSKGTNLTASEDVFPFRANFLTSDQLLYTADGGIRLRNLGNGVARKVSFLAKLTLDRPSWKPKDHRFSERQPQQVLGLSSPRLSPNGRAVVLGALNDIYVLREGKAPLAVTHDGFVDSDPAWNGDGSSVLYTSDKHGSPAVYEKSLENGIERQLTDNNTIAYRSALSPDGQLLAFVDQHNDLQLLNLSTGMVRKLASSVTGELIGRPSWSPDNRHIAFTDRTQLNRRFREGYNEIRVVDTVSGASSFVPPRPFSSISDRGDSGPAWSPDGHWMAFVMESVLWIMPVHVDGTPTGPARKLTAETADSPSWKSDSQQVLYIHHGKLKTVDLSGSIADSLPANLSFRNEVPKTDVVIHAGRFWDGVSDKARRNVDVLVRRDRIFQIRPHRDKHDPNSLYVEAGDKTVMPGLIEMHSHPEDRGLSYGARWWRMYLSMGVTSTQSMGGFLNEAIATREALQSGALLGPRLFATGELFDGERISHPPTRPIVSDAQLKLEIDRQAALNPDFFKTYVQLPASRMAQVAAAAQRLGIASGSHYLWSGIASGETLTTHLSATTRMGYSETISPSGRTYSDVTTLYTGGHFGIVHTPFEATALVSEDPAMLDDPRVQTLFPTWDIQTLRAAAAAPLSDAANAAIKRSGAALLAIVHGGGILGLGTDAPLVVPAFHLQLGLRSLVEGGFTPVEALRTVTSSAALLIGVEKDIGSLEPGKLADLIIVEGDPLQNIRDVYHVDQIMKGGILYTQRDIETGFKR